MLNSPCLALLQDTSKSLLLPLVVLASLSANVLLYHRWRSAHQRWLMTRSNRAQQLIHVSRAQIAGRISASLAHDLRQPISAILLHTQSAQRLAQKAELDEAILKDILEDIVSDVCRMDSLVIELRRLLKPIEYDKKDLDLNEALNEILKLLSGLILKNGVTTTTELETNLPPLQWDFADLRQVIVSLTLAALDALKECPRERRVLHICTKGHDNNNVEISFHHQGQLSAQAVAPLLKGLTSYSSATESGTALRSCASLIHQHGGSIHAEATKPVGMIFRVTLPSQNRL